jgi:hypothetical protein
MTATATARVLDAALPRFDFHEVHERHVAAPPDAVWAAALEVKPLEVRTLAPLMALRLAPGLIARRSDYAIGREDTLLELFVKNGFAVLGEGERELALGAIGPFWQPFGYSFVRFGTLEEFATFSEPGLAKAGVDLRVRADGDGALVSTETRVDCTDTGARRAFGLYWRLIQPGSALIRHSWLNAVRRRAL